MPPAPSSDPAREPSVNKPHPSSSKTLTRIRKIPYLLPPPRPPLPVECKIIIHRPRITMQVMDLYKILPHAARKIAMEPRGPVCGTGRIGPTALSLKPPVLMASCIFHLVATPLLPPKNCLEPHGQGSIADRTVMTHF